MKPNVAQMDSFKSLIIDIMSPPSIKALTYLADDASEVGGGTDT